MTNIYDVAKNSLGKHLTLNDNVLPEVGCAEALSAVLSLAGYDIPQDGIAGTAELYTWLSTNPKFLEISSPEKGSIIISPTGSGNGKVRGHCGVLGAFGKMYPNDYGILSNDSNSGLFLELWRLSEWQRYYGNVGYLDIHFFRAL